MITKEIYEKLIERKCSEEGCFKYYARGYIYCQGHLYDFPTRMDEKDIQDIKEYERCVKNTKSDVKE